MSVNVTTTALGAVATALATVAATPSATPAVQMTFDQCWMQPISGGLQWSTLVGTTLILYCYAFSKGELLWRVLFFHAISGFCGMLMETSFSAARVCGNDNPALAAIILVNEVNWIVHEATTVLYSFIKTAVILTSDSVKRTFQILMLVLFVIFAVLRVNIGRLRFSHNALMDNDIEQAHSYAFVVWGLADLIIMVLLVWNVHEHITRSANQRSSAVLTTLMSSSVPRIAVIFFNTLAIVIIGQLFSTNPVVLNINSFVWLVKGAYPAILLLDILLTRSLLQDSRERSGKQVGPGGDGRTTNPNAYAMKDINSSTGHTGSNGAWGAKTSLV
ncbi:hypothetical protein HK101_007307 [Irineochytrium annulatum]|nr:hypothetical protein HK101_007307 [Irineochytrium annulatum]